MAKKKSGKSRRGDKENAAKKLEEKLAALAGERDSLQARLRDSESAREAAVREAAELRDGLEKAREEADALGAGSEERLRDSQELQEKLQEELAARNGLALQALTAERDSLQLKLGETESARATAVTAREQEVARVAGLEQEIKVLGDEVTSRNDEIAGLKARAERAESGEAEAKRGRAEAQKAARRIPPGARGLLIASSAAALLFLVLTIIGFARSPGEEAALSLAEEEQKHRETTAALIDTRKALDKALDDLADVRRQEQDAEGSAAAAERARSDLNAAKERAEKLDSQAAELRTLIGEQRARYRRLQRAYNAARAAEREGKLADAIGLYRRALGIADLQEDKAELRAHVAELERRLRFKTKLAEADRLAERASWKAARAAYLGVLKIAADDEAGEVKLRLAAAEREIRYLDLVEKALAASRAAEWRKTLDAAREAADVKPDGPEARDLVLKARRALGPEREITNSIGLSLVLVPAGEFVMGSDTGDADERPRHEVELDGFYVGEFQVTNVQFERFDSSHERTRFSPADDMPAVAVSWRDADAFCRWLSEREGVEYRLPTEAEWEKAARGPSETDKEGRTFPWGDEEPGAGDTWRCNIAVGESEEGWAADGHRYVSPVGSYPGGASPFGAHGLAGNVWEWCLDWYRSDYYQTGEIRNPKGPASGRQRVLRGGSFGNAARHARCANRAAHAPDLVEATVGFRCVRAMDQIFQEAP